MSPSWHTTDRLLLDVDGHLWERYRGSWAWLGPIERAEVSPSLAGELAECLDLWLDKFDPRAEAEAAYRATVLRRP